MCFTAPAGAPAVPGRRHECGRVQGWGPSRKIPARAPPAEGLRFQWPLGNVVPSGPVAQRAKKERKKEENVWGLEISVYNGGYYPTDVRTHLYTF
ncbi:hypothetical protein NDU88_005425 [Pleurodeles waltl]|uniref:Uncharacterized protein n=1 Tax=Pleurodeles waltl TaxID=8319 RepID=A0AAV7VJ04_PLEWA|nr:hypothetical protein NDU88_005425 [Pleurodeles waltl]